MKPSPLRTAIRACRQIDLVIMDVCLPAIDGREAVRILRRNGFKAPIVMLTGHDTDSDTILGLDSEANDYVTKPLRFAVLLARVRTNPAVGLTPCACARAREIIEEFRPTNGMDNRACLPRPLTASHQMLGS